MKCTAKTNKLNHLDTMLSGVPQYDKEECGGEMRKVAPIRTGVMLAHEDEQGITIGVEEEVKTLYQCEHCKTIQLQH